MHSLKQDGIPPAAADVRAPLEAVELQSEPGWLAGTPACVSGGRLEETLSGELGGHDM